MLKDKVIIITGSGAGQGRAAARIFAAAGARVVVADRSEDGGRETVDMVAKDGGTAVFQRTDVSDEAAVKEMVAAAVRQFGRLDGAFNNAGIGKKDASLIPDLSSADYDDNCAVNERGVFLCMKYEIAAMRETGGGAIVNNSSGLGLVGTPAAAAYVSAKHAVVGLTRAGAAEARTTGVRVNCVLPGLINTGFTFARTGPGEVSRLWDIHGDRISIGRWGEPEDVAYAAKWLLSDESAFINGVMLPVDGGFMAR